MTNEIKHEEHLMKARVNWFEIAGTDVDGLVKFYRELFDWEPVDPDETEFFQVAPVPGAERDGNPGGIWDGGKGGNPYAIFYAEVDDLDAALAKAELVGGSVLLKSTEQGPVRYGHILDPSGNRIGVYERLPA